jgi:hypothetical protein
VKNRLKFRSDTGKFKVLTVTDGEKETIRMALEDAI